MKNYICVNYLKSSSFATQKEALEYAEKACKETNITCVVYEKKFEVIPEVVVSVKEVSKNARCKNSKN